MASKGKPDKDYMLELSGKYTIAFTPPLLFLFAHCKYTLPSLLTKQN
jgi:hypothetical protein